MPPEERPSNLYAGMVEAHFDRGLARHKRPPQREIDLEVLLIAALQAAGGTVEVTREAMFAADESGLEPTHAYRRDRHVHVLALRPITPPPEGPAEEDPFGAATDGQPQALTG